jgi:hypothetical protein
MDPVDFPYDNLSLEPGMILVWSEGKGHRAKWVVLSIEEDTDTVLLQGIPGGSQPGAGVEWDIHEFFKDSWQIAPESLCGRCSKRGQMEDDYLCRICRYGRFG